MARLRVHSLRPGSVPSRYFDLLRGVAAIYVMAFHLRPQLYVSFRNVEAGHPARVLLGGLYLVTTLGYQFVMAFFVLSGFLIGSSVLRAVQEDRFYWPEYLVNRVSRLWVVLLPALALTAAWGRLAMHFSPDPSLLRGTLGWRVLLGNVFFTQGILVPNFGNNLPLWSLDYEFWYYLLFPCVIRAITGGRPRTRIVHAAAAIAIGIFVRKTVLLYFSVWLLGALLSIAPAPSTKWMERRRPILAVTCTLMALSMIVCKLVTYNLDFQSLAASIVPEFSIGVCFALLMYVVLHLSAQSVVPAANAPTSWALGPFIAAFSYTLYLTHYPVLFFLRLVMGYETWQPDPLHLSLGALLALALLVYAWAIARVTEAQTPWVRLQVWSAVKRLGVAGHVSLGGPPASSVEKGAKATA